MSSLPEDHRLLRGYRSWRWIAALGLAMLVILGSVILAGARTWLAYNSTFGARSVHNDWLHREQVSSYSVDVYDERLAVNRLQVYCLRFAGHGLSRPEFNLLRRQVLSTFSTFAPGTVLGKAASTNHSFPEAYEALRKFLEGAAQLEDGTQGIDQVYALGQDAGAAWEHLTVEANDQEFGARDGMENAIVAFSKLADRTVRIMSVLIGVCMFALCLAAYAIVGQIRAERRRFERFELLLATVGHDLRSPLQALVGAAKLAADDISPAEREKFVRIVHERSAFFTRLLDDLVGLARSESLTFIPAPVDLRAWFDGVCSRNKQLIEGKGLVFEAKFISSVRGIVFDQHRLTQCVDNLLSNAARYTERGKVKLVVRCERLRGEQGSGSLTIRVTDSGRGIRPADQARIFQPFVRLETGVKGMGVGLSMVADLSRTVGGSVNVKSEVGVGSRFTFSVPRVPLLTETQPGLAQQHEKQIRPALAALTPPAEVLSASEAPRVLVVDDDEVILLVIAGMLPLMGFQAETAIGGQEGVAKALAGDYCAVLTDIQMPDLDGFKLASKLRATLNPCPTVIAMTAYTSNPSAERGAEVFDATLRKPVDDGSLIELLDVAAERWKAQKRMPS